MLNYSAGAIQTAQPLFAIKSLSAFIENSDAAKEEQIKIINEPANKIKYLILMGKITLSDDFTRVQELST